MLDLADRWDHAVQADKLQPILPVSFEDVPEEGPRGSIFHAKSTLVAAVLDDATNQAQEGRPDEAAREALLATRISESLKYSDFNSVHGATFEEARALAILKSVVDDLTPSQKADVLDGLKVIKDNSQELSTLTRFVRIQYYDYLARINETPVSIEDVHEAVFLSKRITSDPKSKDTLNFVRNSLLQANSDDAPEYLSELRLAWASEDSNERDVSRLIASL